jgi:hypothetical protein
VKWKVFFFTITNMMTIRNSLPVHVMLEVVASGLYAHYSVHILLIFKFCFLNETFKGSHAADNIYIILTALKCTVRDDVSYVAVLTPTVMKPTTINRKSALN